MNWDDTDAETPTGSSAPPPTARTRRSRRPCGPRPWASSSGRSGCASSSTSSSRRPAQRGATADHVLLSGAPGLGKTTLSMIIAAEMDAPIRITSGPAIQHAGDLAAILSSLQEGEVLFLDEIHRMSRPAEEMLYMAMEDFRVDVIVGKGPGATAIPLELPPFTLVGATTRAGLLPPPLRDRFGFTAHMEFYEPAELERVIHRSAAPPRRRRSTPRAPPRSPAAPAARPASPTGCCAGSATTPRSRPTAWSPGRSPAAALEVYEVDARGLDRLDRAVLARPAQALRRRPRRPVHARRRGGGGARDRRGGGRALPGTRGPARPHPPRAGRHPRRLGAPGPRTAPAAARTRRHADNRACSGRDGAETRRARNPGAMLGVVPSARPRLDSADALPFGRRAPPPRSRPLDHAAVRRNSPSRESS